MGLNSPSFIMNKTIKPLYDEHSKLTLIIDGNWLLMSRLAVLRNKYTDTQSLVHELKLLMIRSINSMTRTLPEVDNIIFVADGGSWRAKLPIPPSLLKKGITYKGNREKTEGFDWDCIFDSFEQFIDDISKWSHITVTREYGIEGDDWCWWWSMILNNDNTNVIIWSADKDLTQLVKTNTNNCVFTVTFYSRGSKSIITMDNNFKTDNSLLASFLNPNYTNNYNLLKSVINKATEIKQINPSDIIIDKVFRGDSGDNILPVITKQTKTGKQTRLTTKQLDTSIDIWDDSSISNYINTILESKQYKDKVSESSNIILEHTLYNRQLVALSDKAYPKEILSAMEEHNYYTKNNNLSIVEQRIKGETDELTDLLNGI